MPIRAEHRQFYGREFRDYRLELIAEAGGPVCSKCGALYERINAAHQDHDPAHLNSVALMCPSCHARHDAKHRFAIMRRNRAEERGPAA